MHAMSPTTSLPPADARAPRATWMMDDGQPVLELAGDWRREGPPVKTWGEAPGQAPVRYATGQLGDYDSTLPAFIFAHLRKVRQRSNGNGAPAKPPLDGLPPNLLGLLELTLAVPEGNEAGGIPDEQREMWKLGEFTIHAWEHLVSVAEFTGQCVLALGRWFAGRAQFRSRDFWLIVQECGAQALPIVSLLSFLSGLILAFVGDAQLANFGATLYVADLVAIAMVREMGVIMTSVIMSGRTGAACAAQLGSMNANEEIDALRTFGFNPYDFLVLPRVIALTLMMPLLTLYSNAVGILGGMLVGSAVGIPPVIYWHESLASLTLTTASLGVMKSFVFGAVIAMSGCMEGMRAGHSSAAVGRATTRAVVASITAIVILDSGFAAIFTILDI